MKALYKPTLKEAQVRIHTKRIYLTLQSEEAKATCEIAPLEGWSLETLTQAKAQLDQVIPLLLKEGCKIKLDKLNLFPSVHYGIKSAILDLIDPIKEPICAKTYGLLMGSFDEILVRAKELQEEGFDKAKVKLGDFSLDEGCKLIERLAKHFELRVDLNQKWNIQKSIGLCERFPDFFTYLEEPSLDPNELKDFPYPFALDETLRGETPLTPLLKNPHLKALVIKPSLLYPFDHLCKLNIPCVLSSCFESAVGIEQLKKCIHRNHLSKWTHGFDTLRYA